METENLISKTTKDIQKTLFDIAFIIFVCSLFVVGGLHPNKFITYLCAIVIIVSGLIRLATHK